MRPYQRRLLRVNRWAGQRKYATTADLDKAMREILMPEVAKAFEARSGFHRWLTNSPQYEDGPLGHWSNDEQT